jgi:hypothetical protein
MIVELQRFGEFKDGWFDHRTREYMLMEPLIINLEYVASVRRYPIHGDIEMCEISMADHGRCFVVDKTYEEMRDLLKARKPA